MVHFRSEGNRRAAGFVLPFGQEIGGRLPVGLGADCLDWKAIFLQAINRFSGRLFRPA
jgi:hypothetical protein